MSVQIADHKIALRNFLRGNANVTAVVPSERIVLEEDKVTHVANWIVLSRSGGNPDSSTPMRVPRVDIVCYGVNRWEAVRIIETVATVLKLFDPPNSPRIEHSGVILTDMRPEGDVIEGTNDRIPGVEARVPFTVLAIRMNRHHAA
jgi:hypothetical protein